MQETQVPSQGQEDPLENGMATHSSIFAWRIPMDRGGWRVTVHRDPQSGTQLSHFEAAAAGILVWRSPWTEEPGGLQSIRVNRVGHKGTGMLSLGHACALSCFSRV